MIKVTIDDRNIKEQITIDPYVPIDVKWGNWNEVEENTRYCRFGDFKKSLLEVGVGSKSGLIRSITLVEAKEIYLNNSKYSYKMINCEQGIPILSADGWTGTDRLDIQSQLVVSTLDDEVVLSFGDGTAVKCIQSGRVKFGLNKFDELCIIIVGDLTVGEMNELNSSLKYML